MGSGSWRAPVGTSCPTVLAERWGASHGSATPASTMSLPAQATSQGQLWTSHASVSTGLVGGAPVSSACGFFGSVRTVQPAVRTSSAPDLSNASAPHAGAPREGVSGVAFSSRDDPQTTGIAWMRRSISDRVFAVARRRGARQTLARRHGENGIAKCERGLHLGDGGILEGT